MVYFFVFLILIPSVDFLFKIWVKNNVSNQTFLRTFIPFLNITYVKNFGAAYSLFWGGRYALILISVLTILMVLYFVFVKKINNQLFLIASSFVIGGGIGNLIDRIFFGYVIDYLKLSFFSPICNISDYFITFGAILFVFYFLLKSN